MIQSALRYIRRKPKAVREQYAFWIACCFTSVVVVLWLVQLSYRYDQTDDTPISTEAAEPSSFANFLDDTQKQIEEVKDVVQNELPAVLEPRASSTATTTLEMNAPDTPPTNQNIVQPDSFPRSVRIATSTTP